MHSDPRRNPYIQSPHPAGDYPWAAPPPSIEQHRYNHPHPPYPPSRQSFSSAEFSYPSPPSFYPPPQYLPQPPPHTPSPPYLKSYSQDFYRLPISHDLPTHRPHYAPLSHSDPIVYPSLDDDRHSFPSTSEKFFPPGPQYQLPGFQRTAQYPQHIRPASALSRFDEGHGTSFHSQPNLDFPSSQQWPQHHSEPLYFAHSSSFSPGSQSQPCSSSHCYFPHDMDGPPADTANGGEVPHSGILEKDQPSKRSLKFVLLYGTLDVWIHSARNLPNMDVFSDSLRQCLNVFNSCKKAVPQLEEKITYHTQRKITSDPYVCVVLKDATVARTRVISNNQDPDWDEHFVVPVAHKVAEVELVVKDNDMLGAQYIGEVKIPAEQLLSETIDKKFFDVVAKDGKPCRPGAELSISMKYCPVEEDPLFKHGVGTSSNYRGVPNTYFPLRKGGRLTLYQDAHVPDNPLPEIKLDKGMTFEHRGCWEDICQAILDAQHLIYIAGWSIYTKTKLVRDTKKDRKEIAYKNLGELLKHKGDTEALRVLLLVWDDKTSHSIINNEGVMGTHDEETKKFFKHSSVGCLLSPRYGDNKLSWVKQKVVGTLFTHHQKLVIVDAQRPGNNNRMLVAFIGGLDLCDGRYDTPEHHIFHNLNTVFQDDYHNPTFAGKAESGGPRQPWHDLHCKIEGPAVYDVLKNFEQRWLKASKWHGLGLRVRTHGLLHDRSLINLQAVSWATVPGKEGQHNDVLNVTKENDSETWHVQIFRSIDSGSVKGFPKSVPEAEKANLVGGKNIAIDMSIHKAYIKAIRSAQHFIYIENQYFLGSSFAWPNYKNAGANHLVPIELALKIVSKIKAKERFAVYVVIPMWPEGSPTSASVQEILFFQAQTMEMMYTLIAEALESVKEDLDEDYHPTDYLNFFCLGNREVKSEDEQDPKAPPNENSTQAQVQKSRRFMIYVHAKGMIVDDEYVIIGSANINQRSMDGARDTEIAMGAYQPHHSWARKNAAPRGQIYGYRMSLWAEHLQAQHDSFREPWKLNCVKEVRKIAEEYWKQYTAEEVIDMKGHLLPYPVKVERNGQVVPLPDFEVFPDVGGKILGTNTTLPDSLTT